MKHSKHLTADEVKVVSKVEWKLCPLRLLVQDTANLRVIYFPNFEVVTSDVSESTLSQA